MDHSNKPLTGTAATQLLDEITRFLRDEQAMFGDDMIAANAMPRKEEVMTPQREPDSGSLSLFETTAPLTTEPWGTAATLEDLNRQICECVKCPLGQTRTKFVFGVGNPKATLLLIGEAPGADEDLQGEPFVGRAGQLLNKILEAIHFRREDVFICNILKCRPPNNRNPEADEVEQCLPYLRKQIRLIEPKVILCMGLVAAGHLLGTRESLTRLRGKVLSYENTPVMVTYHPAALLRNPNWKRPAWEDVQAVRKLHDDLLAGSRNKE